jgi:hypothetical protein
VKFRDGDVTEELGAGDGIVEDKLARKERPAVKKKMDDLQVVDKYLPTNTADES